MTAPNHAPAIHIQTTLDIVTADLSGGVSVLLGDGSGGFAASTTSIAAGVAPLSVALGDVNGDGILDIVTSNNSGDVSVLLGNGLGGFTASTTSIGGGDGPISVALGDVNGDGKLDIVTANQITNNVSVLLGDGLGGFTASTTSIGGGSGPTSIALGDVNGDGKLDIVTANIFSNNVSVLLGNGLGGFTASIASLGGGISPSSVALGDVNGDGKLDIVTDAGAGNISVLLGDGLGGFTAHTASLGGGFNALSVAFGDVNGDGKLDIVTANLSGDVSVLLGDGLGGFTASTTASGATSYPVSVALADVNGDGKLDIVTANQNGNVSVLLGDGLGGFTASTTSIGGGSAPQSVAVGNLDSVAAAAEDTALVFSSANHNAITVSDVDGGSGSETVTLSVAHGTLALATLAGLTGVTGNDTGSVTFSGTIADLNTALDGLIYQGVLNYNGADTLNIGINDNGNTGTGGGSTAFATQAILVAAVNDAPTIGTAAPATVAEDTALVFSSTNHNAITVSDVDGGSGSETVTLSVAHGTLALGSLAGLTGVFGNNSSSMTFSGTIANLDAALDDLTYQGVLNYNGADTLNIGINDNGNTGTGGGLTASATQAISVTAVNDAPTIGTGAPATIAEDTPLVLSSAHHNAITVSDVDGGSGIETVTVSVAHGTLALATLAGLTGVTGNDTGSVTFNGTIADLNAALDGLTYQGVLNYNGADTLNIGINDNGNTGTGGSLTASALQAISVTAVNDAPTIGTGAAATVAEDTALVFSSTNHNAITVADVDGGFGSETVTLSVAHGTLTLGSLAGLTSVFGNNSSSMTFSGTIAELNAALDGLIYQGVLNYNGADTLSIGINDNGNTGTGGGLTASATEAITVTAVNDAPTIAALAPITIAEDTPYVFSSTVGTAIAVSDVDGGTGIETVTLFVSHGTMTLGSTANLQSVINNSSIDILTGTIANLNLALQGTTYTPAANYNGLDELTVTIDDNGNTGGTSLSYSEQALIAISAVNDPPVNTVPGAFSTAAGVDHAITGLSVSDVDATSMTTTLHVDHGTLTVGDAVSFGGSTVIGVGGVTLDGNGTGTVTMSGDLAQIGAILAAANNIIYHSAAGFTGTDHLTMTSNDGGGTGSGGPMSDTDTVAITVLPKNGSFDFDADGHSDFLWINDNGTASIWDDGQIAAAHWIANPGTVANGLHFAGTGDFDGNGHSDSLWRNDNGAVSIWDNGQSGSAHTIAAAGVVASSWHIAGTGDFDGNGQSDILWRNDNGAASIWDNGQIGGAHIISGAGVVASSWHIAGTGDFDGNGHSDILWVNDNGSASIWDNGQIGGAHVIANAGTLTNGWHFAGTGDFDGNGHSDILWVNDNGSASIWDNGAIGGAHLIASAGTLSSGWHFAMAGDFDGNGKSDILWNNDNGALSIWNNGQISGAHIAEAAGTISSAWHIV